MKLFVEVKPRSARNHVEQIDATHFRVWVRALPDRGKANDAVGRLLSEFLGIPKSSLVLASGAASRNKTFRLDV